MPSAETTSRDAQVELFHQILVWPVQVMGEGPEIGGARHWTKLAEAGEACAWRELDDEFTDDPADFQERHYREFVAFLPHVQRFLYGERARGSGGGYGESPIRVYRRGDVRKARCRLSADAAPFELEIVHCDLYFFFDVDVVILALEVKAENLPLSLAQEIMLRFGRAYPGGWTEAGVGQNCFAQVEWLDASGAVLAASDYQDRAKFLASVCAHQAATISAHWEFLLRPLTLNQKPDGHRLRYRQLEHYRMPQMAFLAMRDVSALTRADQVRLALAGPPGEEPPMSRAFLRDFERDHCYDRFWEPGRDGNARSW